MVYFYLGTVRGSSPSGGKIFSTRSDRACGPTKPPIQWVSGLFPEGKAGGAWRWPPITI